MKHLFLIFIIFSCASREKVFNPKFPQMIDLSKKIKPPLHKYVYDEVVVNSPNFNVTQNHEGLKRHYSVQDDLSSLCSPSALATTLIQEKSQNEKAKNLQLNGFSNDGMKVDANQLIHQLVSCANVDAQYGTYNADLAGCVKKIYESSNAKVEVRLIMPSSSKDVPKGVFFEKRKPTIQDIIYYLKNGYRVLGSRSSVRLEGKNKWELFNSHSFVIQGYARQKTWPDDLLFLFISDPGRTDLQIEYPLHETALVTKVSNSKNFPEGI